VASKEHVGLLAQGVATWNAWRADNRLIRPDLRGADLKGRDLRLVKFSDADLKGADMTGAHLEGARFGDSYLRRAILRYAHLEDANASGANLRHADLTGAHLARASFRRADLSKAILNDADLTEAILDYARLVETRLEKATLARCSVYGVSAWNLKLDTTTQSDLMITSRREPKVTVENLAVAQFVYLLIQNRNIRDVIDTTAAKMVLILGRFTPERKAVLDAVRDAVRLRNLLPIVFDFEGPKSRDVEETVRALANLCRFIVADITDPRSVIQELTAIAPDLPSVPVQAVIHESQEPWAMFITLQRKCPWVLEPYRYASGEQLVVALDVHLLADVEEAVRLHRPAAFGTKP
jgi:uncharacterized protein YjbI with pentapeptide repeats